MNSVPRLLLPALVLAASAVGCIEPQEPAVYASDAPPPPAPLVAYPAPRPAYLPATPTPLPLAPFPPSAATVCEGDADRVGHMRAQVYSLPLETRQLPDFREMQPIGTFCTTTLNVPRHAGFPGFPGVGDRFEWFGVDYRGTFDVRVPGVFTFRVTSDDGSKLFIDHDLVVDNDGYHLTRARQGAVVLAAGVHHVEVQYWQGPGPMALILEIARPDEGFGVFSTATPLEGEGT